MTYLAVMLIAFGAYCFFNAYAWNMWLLGVAASFIGSLMLEAVIERLFHSIWRLQDHLGLEDDYEFRHK